MRYKEIDINILNNLNFSKPDTKRFKALKFIKMLPKKISLFEILIMHLKNLLKGGISVSLFLRDIKDCFYSTSIKFKIR